MGASVGKPPAAPDPNTVLALQNQYNRSNSVGPFGSQTWSTNGPGGHETLTTSLSPDMQNAANRAFAAAATPYQKEYVPQGMDQLASAILGRVGGRYGLSGSNLNTNFQQQKAPQGQSPQPPMMAGMGLQTQGSPMQGLGVMGGMQQPSGGPTPQGGPTALGGLLGANMGGLGNANPMSAMQGLQQGGLAGLGLQTQQPGLGAQFNRMGG